MKLILTMAGKYSRFTNEGYKVPKYLFPWKEHTILSEILKQMAHGFDDVFLIGNLHDRDYTKHIMSIMEHHNISRGNLVMIEDTAGQAESAVLGTEILSNLDHDLSGPVVFHNVDTILYNRDYSLVRKELTLFNGYIDIFQSNNHEYSYVLTESSVVVEISEKVVISNTATSGMYGFDSIDMFWNYYDEPSYISNVYRNMIEDNKAVTTGPLYKENDTLVLGTPQEYINASRTR